MFHIEILFLFITVVAAWSSQMPVFRSGSRDDNIAIGAGAIEKIVHVRAAEYDGSMTTIEPRGQDSLLLAPCLGKDGPNKEACHQQIEVPSSYRGPIQAFCQSCQDHQQEKKEEQKQQERKRGKEQYAEYNRAHVAEFYRRKKAVDPDVNRKAYQRKKERNPQALKRKAERHAKKTAVAKQDPGERERVEERNRGYGRKAYWTKKLKEKESQRKGIDGESESGNDVVQQT